jgi:hypothetical protein
LTADHHIRDSLLVQTARGLLKEIYEHR